jgi:hypothetical protein
MRKSTQTKVLIKYMYIKLFINQPNFQVTSLLSANQPNK